jgi:hypothetical protein
LAFANLRHRFMTHRHLLCAILTRMLRLARVLPQDSRHVQVLIG